MASIPGKKLFDKFLKPHHMHTIVPHMTVPKVDVKIAYVGFEPRENAVIPPNPNSEKPIVSPFTISEPKPEVIEDPNAFPKPAIDVPSPFDYAGGVSRKLDIPKLVTQRATGGIFDLPLTEKESFVSPMPTGPVDYAKEDNNALSVGAMPEPHIKKPEALVEKTKEQKKEPPFLIIIGAPLIAGNSMCLPIPLGKFYVDLQFKESKLFYTPEKFNPDEGYPNNGFERAARAPEGFSHAINATREGGAVVSKLTGEPVRENGISGDYPEVKPEAREVKVVDVEIFEGSVSLGNMINKTPNAKHELSEFVKKQRHFSPSEIDDVAYFNLSGDRISRGAVEAIISVNPANKGLSPEQYFDRDSTEYEPEDSKPDERGR